MESLKSKASYVYQLLTTGSMEEDKYRRTTRKELVSCMMFSEEFVEDSSKWQAEKIEDEILREMVEEDKSKAIHMIMKNEMDSVRNNTRHTEGQQCFLEGSELVRASNPGSVKGDEASKSKYKAERF
jgi:20S proteasome alpha/beta subunit